MVDLELVGIHDDGEHLIFRDANDKRYRLAISEELRAAVRRDRPRLEHLRAHPLRPREIQSLIRGGASAQEVADQAGIEVESVRRYEGPVLAERGYVAERARALPVTRTEDAPTLGDLVIDRLAARNVTEVAWDAYRPEGQDWHVHASYTAGKQDFVATWSVDLNAGHFSALDDEARWLSEIDLADSPYRHLTTVDDPLYDVESDGDIPALEEIEPDPAAESSTADPSDTETILQELDKTRGIRQPLEPEGHSEPTLWDDPPAAHPPLSRPQDATDARVLQLPENEPDQPDVSVPPIPPEEPVTEEEPDTRRRRRDRRGRTSVPSWDEIVFGAKND